MNEHRLDVKESKITINPLIIIFLTFFGFVFFGGIGALLGNTITSAYEVDVTTILQAAEAKVLALDERQAIRWMNLLSHIFAFTLVAFLIALIAKKETPLLSFLGLNRSLNARTIFWSLIALLLLFPSVQLAFWLNLQIPLPEWLAQLGKNQDWVVTEVLRMEYGWEFAFVLIVAAVAPAIGEELLFRGLLQVQFSKLFNNPHIGIWMAAFLFSAIHMQFDGFFPRMFLGAMLGYMYLWSDSLWLPILIHFLFNGIQVFTTFFFPELVEPSLVMTLDTSDYLLGIGAVLLLIPVLIRLKSAARL